MTDPVTPEEVRDSPFQAAINIFNRLMEMPGGIPVQTPGDSLALVQTLIMIDLHNQMVEQRELLEQIVANTQKES